MMQKNYYYLQWLMTANLQANTNFCELYNTLTAHWLFRCQPASEPGTPSSARKSDRPKIVLLARNGWSIEGSLK